MMASGGRWDADCRKAMQELTSGKAIREDVALLMAPHANFEQFLTPAPLSICILGKVQNRPILYFWHFIKSNKINLFL